MADLLGNRSNAGRGEKWLMFKPNSDNGLFFFFAPILALLGRHVTLCFTSQLQQRLYILLISKNHLSNFISLHVASIWNTEDKVKGTTIF